MADFIFEQNSILIAGSVLLSMIAAVEIGFRIAQRAGDEFGASLRSHVGAIQASLLGLMALLLGFTLSLALQRYDIRSEAVVDEANAIGTAWLRAQLLPVSVREPVLSRMRRHVDLRVEAGAVDMAHTHERSSLLKQSNENLDQIWSLAVEAAKVKSSSVTSGLFIQALNDMIDSYGRRDAALRRHVPQPVLLLLFCTFLLTSGVVGYAAGIAGNRPSVTTHVLIALIVILVFVILDLDRPRRGLIRIDQTSLIELKSAIHASGTLVDSSAPPSSTR